MTEQIPDDVIDAARTLQESDNVDTPRLAEAILERAA
jgi:hypothetical protein